MVEQPGPVKPSFFCPVCLAPSSVITSRKNRVGQFEQKQNQSHIPDFMAADPSNWTKNLKIQGTLQPLLCIIKVLKNRLDKFIQVNK